MKKLLLSTLIFMACFGTKAFAQADNSSLTNRANLVFGVSQLLAGGFNVEGNLFWKRLAFDYSHGVNLRFSNELLEAGPDREQQLDIVLPWTTGFGVGYRFNNWLNLRVEPKWHRFELHYTEVEMEIPTSFIADYTTFTLGLGLYANLRPFKNQDNWLRGLMIAPNVRWWPQVGTSLDNGELWYDNVLTGQAERHEAREIGIANTPFFANVSIGYSLEF